MEMYCGNCKHFVPREDGVPEGIKEAFRLGLSEVNENSNPIGKKMVGEVINFMSSAYGHRRCVRFSGDATFGYVTCDSPEEYQQKPQTQ